MARTGFGAVTSIFNSDDFTNSASTLGIGSVRLSAYWSDIEPNNIDWDFSDVDPNVELAAADGLSIYLTLASDSSDPSVPAWVSYDCDGDQSCVLADFYNFVYAVISRYDGYDVTYGILNEPDIDSFPTDLIDQDPGQYSLYVLEADYARNAVDSSVAFGLPETTDCAAQNGWLAEALGDITLQSQDIITGHWYDTSECYTLPDYMAAVNSIVGGREVWLTETGQNDATDAGSAVTNFVYYAGDFNFTHMFEYVLHAPGVSFSMTDGSWNPTAIYTEYENLIAYYVCS